MRSMSFSEQLIINRNVERSRRQAMAWRINEVSRYATLLQDATGCKRTEALRIAERRIPRNHTV